MNFYFRRAQKFIDNARTDLQDDDDASIANAGNLIAQAIEYMLKGLLDELGITYATNHKVRNLVISLPDSYAQADWYSILFLYGKDIEDWLTCDRYVKSFNSDRTVMLKVLDVFPSLFTDATSQQSYVSTVKTKIQKILYKLNDKVTSPDDVIRLLPAVEMDDACLFEAVKVAIKIIYNNKT